MGSRRRARIVAVQALYGWDLSRTSIEDLLAFAWLEPRNLDETSLDFARLLVAGTIENLEAVDEILKRHLEHWELGRVAKVDLAILRLSVYALAFLQDIPGTVTIDEAIDISKEYGADDSYRFVNGVLDAVNRSIRQAAR